METIAPVMRTISKEMFESFCSSGFIRHECTTYRKVLFMLYRKHYFTFSSALCFFSFMFGTSASLESVISSFLW